jgi:hypothetical protein
LDEVLFDDAFGLVLVVVAVDVGLVGVEVFSREYDDLGGEAETEGIEGGTLFAFFGAGASAVLRVLAIDGGPVFGFFHFQGAPFWYRV